MPQTESRLEDMMEAALDSLSFLTWPKKASSLFIKYFSILRSDLEFSTVRFWSFETNSWTTPPSASVNCQSGQYDIFEIHVK